MTTGRQLIESALDMEVVVGRFPRDIRLPALAYNLRRYADMYKRMNTAPKPPPGKSKGR